MIRKISFILYILVILTIFPKVLLATTSENLNDGTKKIRDTGSHGKALNELNLDV
tara:strand:- start:361 stop:525 length:165 start_codon:yes stop_codon:yes gene_type:complete